MRVILMGPPGSGKGTQAASIANHLGVESVSSGDLFRDHQKRDTELGRLARSFMERGVYVPDDVTIKMVMDWIGDPAHASGFVLDGFPRTHAQAVALDEEIKSLGGIHRVLFFRVTQNELVRRLTGRMICRQCQTPYHVESSPPDKEGVCDACGGELYERDDDKAEVVTQRIQIYSDETEPVVEYYRSGGKLREIDGEASIDVVGEASLAAVSG
ncbi:MAG: adenylate kinase [Pirellulaceae bacterium]|nr:adenylate kinase [Pirellulaceae bacterium]